MKRFAMSLAACFVLGFCMALSAAVVVSLILVGLKR